MTSSSPTLPPDFPDLGRIRLALFLAGFATFSLLYCVQPILPELAASFAISAATSSLPLSLATGGLAVAIFCAGAVSETLGRRGLMFWSIFLASLLNLLSALLTHWQALTICRMLSGVALGGVPAVALVYLVEELPRSRLGAATGLYVAGNAFGGMCGRIVVSVLTDLMSWRSALVILSLIDCFCAIVFLCLLPPSRHFCRQKGLNLQYHLRAWQDHLTNPAMRLLLMIPFSLMGVFVSVYNYAGFRLSGPEFALSQNQLALIFVVYIFGIVGSGIAGALSDRLGCASVVLCGAIATIFGLLLSLSHWLSIVIIGIIFVTMGFFVAHSAASTWVSKIGRNHHSHATSLYLLAYYVGSSVIGSVSGWFWQHGGWTALASVCIALVSATLITTKALQRQASSA